jgi:hypothetical protein
MHLVARLDPSLARATMRPVPFDHAGIAAGFAAWSFVLEKALFTEMPFIGYDARG